MYHDLICSLYEIDKKKGVTPTARVIPVAAKRGT
jgi:hypothetical protein